MELQTDGLTVITEVDWKCFCEEWGCAEEKGLSATLESTENGDEELAITTEQVSTSDEANGVAESRKPIFKTCPQVAVLVSLFFISSIPCVS